MGLPPSVAALVPGERFRYDLLHALLVQVEDVDADFVSQARAGLPLGDDERLTDSGQWPLREGEEVFEGGEDGWIFWDENYKSVAQYAQMVEEKLRAEVGAGFLQGPLSADELKDVLDSYPPAEREVLRGVLACARLAAILEDPETGKFRIVVDGVEECYKSLGKIHTGPYRLRPVPSGQVK